MLLSFTSKLLATLLGVAITTAALVLLISQTLLNSHYIEGELNITNSYTHLSDAMVSEIVKHADQPDPTIAPKLKAVLTPATLQVKLNLALEQLQAYYLGNGTTAPTIDVSDLAAKAQAAGVPIGEGSGLDKPITLTGNNKVKGVGHTFNQAKMISLAAVVVLAGLLALVCWKRKHWAALPDVLIWVGAQLGIIAAIFTFGPGFAEHYLKFNAASNAFATIGHDLAISIVHDLGKRLAIVAVSFLVAGIGVRILMHKYHPVQKPAFLKQK